MFSLWECSHVEWEESIRNALEFVVIVLTSTLDAVEGALLLMMSFDSPLLTTIYSRDCLLLSLSEDPYSPADCTIWRRETRFQEFFHEEKLTVKRNHLFLSPDGPLRRFLHCLNRPVRPRRRSHSWRWIVWSSQRLQVAMIIFSTYRHCS